MLFFGYNDLGCLPWHGNTFGEDGQNEQYPFNRLFKQDQLVLAALDNGVYRDRNQQFQINAVSRSVLGFGTQSIDFDNDGLLDIVALSTASSVVSQHGWSF